MPNLKINAHPNEVDANKLEGWHTHTNAHCHGSDHQHDCFEVTMLGDRQRRYVPVPPPAPGNVWWPSGKPIPDGWAPADDRRGDDWYWYVGLAGVVALGVASAWL